MLFMKDLFLPSTPAALPNPWGSLRCAEHPQLLLIPIIMVCVQFWSKQEPQRLQKTSCTMDICANCYYREHVRYIMWESVCLQNSEKPKEREQSQNNLSVIFKLFQVLRNLNTLTFHVSQSLSTWEKLPGIAILV